MSAFKKRFAAVYKLIKAYKHSHNAPLLLKLDESEKNIYRNGLLIHFIINVLGIVFEKLRSETNSKRMIRAAIV